MPGWRVTAGRRPLPFPWSSQMPDPDSLIFSPKCSNKPQRERGEKGWKDSPEETVTRVPWPQYSK